MSEQDPRPTAKVDRDGLERVEHAQAGNDRPHDYRRKVGPPPGPAFCLACGNVRQASGSTDAKPCRGVIKVTMRAP